MTSALLIVAIIGQFAQASTGELHLKVVDATGAALASTVTLINDAQQFSATYSTNAQGELAAKRLAFGTYQVVITADGFAPHVGLVRIESVLATEYRITLAVAAIQTQVSVSPPPSTTIDLQETATAAHIGRTALQQRITALPGRALPELVNTQPGWLLEANGILHPRGSEYQTQFVVDGLPLTDNRSPAFAPEFAVDDVQSMRVLTGGYPAEYGRKLGGVIEVVTANAVRRGIQSGLTGSAGSFHTWSGDAHVGGAAERSAWLLTGSLASTDRYLDPPVEENYTNHGTTLSASFRFERDATDRDRVGVILRRAQARFLVPNERLQQVAGQRQDRTNAESAGQFSYQRILSDSAVADVRGYVRHVDASLWSNRQATPMRAEQRRAFREGYVKATVAGRRGIHEWKLGGDAVIGRLDEHFVYQVTDAAAFDPDTAATFAFAARSPDREQALFLQDQLHAGQWTINLGARWDHYALVTSDHSFSPRVAIAWAFPADAVVVRGSYDRTFQTPAFENLLLASSPALDAIGDHVLRLPVQPSRGHFVEAGLTKGVRHWGRLDLTYFRRLADNAADDDVLLNTGVSFPIAFRRSDIYGTEVKLAVPVWKRISAAFAYGYMRGVTDLPITGGLFVEEEAAALLEAHDRVPISQDQRHTARAQVSYRFSDRVWSSSALAFNSGLPVEWEGDRDSIADQFGSRILDRVNFDAERVRPWWTVDLSLGSVLYRGRGEVRAQLDVRNLANRLNVINFAGLFSGTAIAPPRSAAVRLTAYF